MTNAATSSAPVADFYLTDSIHRSLQEKDLLPALHSADTGFVDAELMLAAMNQSKIGLLGPSHLDRQWQSRNNPQFLRREFLD